MAPKRGNEVWENLDAILKTVETRGEPNGLRKGLVILELYVPEIKPFYDPDYRQFFACLVENTVAMNEAQVKRMFELGWHFDHERTWWVIDVRRRD